MSGTLRRMLSGRSLRCIGLLTMVWALALAAVFDTWEVSLLLGTFELGLGIGLGDWVMGEER